MDTSNQPAGQSLTLREVAEGFGAVMNSNPPYRDGTFEVIFAARLSAEAFANWAHCRGYALVIPDVWTVRLRQPPTEPTAAPIAAEPDRRQYTVIGLDETDTHTLRIAAVLEGVQLRADAPHDDPASVFTRWSRVIPADDPGQAEERAEEVYRYGSFTESIRADRVVPGTVLLDPVHRRNGGWHKVVEECTHVGGDVLIRAGDEATPTPFPADQEILVVTDMTP